MNTTTNYITQTALKERGWTNKLIKDFYAVPAQEKPSRTYKNTIIKLYDKEIVTTIEQTENFKSAKEKASRRQQSAKKSIETKTIKLSTEIINKLDVKFPNSLNHYKKQAIKAYNDYNADRINYIHASMDSDPDFLDRITVNYLRHECSEYESRLINLIGKTGKDAAYAELKSHILDVILKTFPELANECRIQMQTCY